LISRAVGNNQKAKVVFITNGDASAETASFFLGKAASELEAEDYLALGRARQQEAARASAKLGLPPNDLIFLSYPDNGLASLWLQNAGERYESEYTGEDRSVYALTYSRAIKGYTRANLIRDIKDIIKELKPRDVYAPSPLDRHKDHVACADFLNKALDELRSDQKNKFIPPQVFYYSIHLPGRQAGPALNPDLSLTQGSHSVKTAKSQAIQEYHSQLSSPTVKRIAARSLENKEYFYRVPDSPGAYLGSVYRQWADAAGEMKRRGYNLNMGVIADVAGDINDQRIDLVRKQKIFSDDSTEVSRLVNRIAQALDDFGVIPVVKHFPGLGSVYRDTHKWLPKVNSSRRDIYNKDLLPYKDLIRSGRHFMVMTSHAVYPCLDDKPASLSYKIQSVILRKELGFQGLIISDELGMQALGEYAIQRGIPAPHIGELAVLSFAAGTDMAIIYPEPERADEIILSVILAVKQAVKEGRLSRKALDESVSRILKEKEGVFDKDLEGLLNVMTIDEKICQKLIIDIYADPAIALKYAIGGIHARDHKIIPEIQSKAQIPVFIFGQYEGGGIIEAGLIPYVETGYLIGREFARAVKSRVSRNRDNYKQEEAVDQLQEPVFDFSRLGEEERAKIINILAASVDGHIRFYEHLRDKKGFPLPNPEHLSPVSMDNENHLLGVKFRDFSGVPVKWLRNFPDRNTAVCAYWVFKKTFEEWAKEEKARGNDGGGSWDEKMLSRLNRFKVMLLEIK
jgi:beta-glucosidase-like glycosyl hydrolase/LmbE family N-acetylglucosaminyl deacetylase